MIRIKTFISQIRTSVRLKLCFSKTPRAFGCRIEEKLPFKDCGNLKIPKSVAYRHCSDIKTTKATQDVNDLWVGTPGAEKTKGMDELRSVIKNNVTKG